MDGGFRPLSSRTDRSSRDSLSLRILMERVGRLGGFSRTLAELALVYLKIPRIVQECQQLHPLSGLQFVRRHFERLGITVAAVLRDPACGIPASGPAIVVANHPTGLTDGLALMQLVGKARADVSMVVNYLIGEIEEVDAIFRDVFIYVNPFDESKEAKSSHLGLRRIFQALRNGEVIIFFPAGDVASFGWRDLKLVDNPWNVTFGKLIARFEVPVIPVHISNRNSRWFYLLNKLNNKLGLALLFREHFKQSGRTIAVHIGQAQARMPHERTEAFTARLRAQIEALPESS